MKKDPKLLGEEDMDIHKLVLLLIILIKIYYVDSNSILKQSLL